MLRTVEKKRQRGAETIEFILTLMLFLLVFFMIIDFAIAIYNRGTVVNASREGARQGSLYWIDPLLFDPTTPEQNQLLKRLMVESVMTWTQNNLLIDPAGSPLTLTLRINSADTANPLEHVSGSDIVSVDLLYPHNYLVLTTLSGVESPYLRSTTAFGME